MEGLRVGLLGATGAVGQEFLSLFSERRFPISELRPMASARSAGTEISVAGESWRVQQVRPEAFADLDVVFMSAGATRSREFAPHAVAAGARVIDNSSAFRMDPAVPLVVPEINMDVVTDAHRVIANPNCSAIIMLMAVAPLRKLGRIERLIVSTYQSASGAGAAAMEELSAQTADVLAGRPAVPSVMPHPYAFNLFSHNTPIAENGLNEEENKVIEESRKILGDPELRINPTCIRVPILRAHSESLTVEFAGDAPDEDAVRECLAAAPGVRVVDDRAANHFPMPNEASGTDDVLVGRIRRDPSHPSAISLFVAGDQLRKGAALNAVQIAERLFGVS